MKVGLVALDIDGTLLQGGYAPSPAVCRAVHALAKEVPVVIATGRRVRSALPVAEALNLQGTMIALNGGALASAQDGRLIKTVRIGPSAGELLEVAQELKLSWAIAAPAGGEEVLLSPLDLRAHRLKGDAERPPTPKERASALYLSVWGDREALDAFRAAALACGDVMVSPFFESEGRGWMVECYPQGVRKERALSDYARLIGVNQADVVAVGDGHNDVGLLAWAGRGVAMGNALPAAKAAAGEVIGSCADDGLAHFLLDLLSEPAAREA